MAALHEEDRPDELRPRHTAGQAPRLVLNTCVDADGLIRRISWAMLLSSTPEPMWSRTEFWDFGLALTIELPLPSETTEPATLREITRGLIGWLSRR